MSAESYNSDDERYADDTFEQESDTDVPEVAEIESEISEVSDADDDDDERLPSVKMNTGPIRRNSNFRNILSAPNHTDAVPFDSSSDEEDDVIVGQTLAEINTPSMHFEDEQNTTPMRRELRQLRHESSHHLKSQGKQSGDSSVSEEEAEEDSEDEKEFQRIRYLLQNSAKTPAMLEEKHSQSQETKSSQEEETEGKLDKEKADEGSNNAKESDVDPIPELIERVMEQFTPKPQIPPQIQTDYMEIVQNSLTSFQTDAVANEKIDTLITDDAPQSFMNDESIRMTFSFEPNNILNPANIAKAFFDAMNTTNVTFAPSNERESSLPAEDLEENLNVGKSADMENNVDSNSLKNETIDNHQEEHYDGDPEQGDKEVELEHIGHASPSPIQPEVHDDDADDGEYDDESYFDTQFEYQITSKTPSCFNSEDYVFHANFIRPSPSSDKLRVRPQPRKNMSFSNERIREIERHNQILLRKILTQKPTYTSKSAQHKVQPNKISSQTHQQQVRLTTSAVNRKKQQRQIDLDNQVLKRKIEAIAIRRRPLISS